MASFEILEEPISEAKIKIIGVGGGGCNAVKTMYDKKLDRVDFMIANTDLQVLNSIDIPTKLQLGGALTRGLGAGFDPKVGREATLEDKETITEWIGNADMIFITAGMGGGTGTGGAPIIAEIAKEMGVLSVAVVSTPFQYEGREKEAIAREGLDCLKDVVDSLIVIPNQKLLNCTDEDVPLWDAFRKANEVLYQAVKGISDTITSTGLMNIDFNDVKRIMQNRGMAIMGIGVASGKNRAVEAAEKAISSPLFDCDIRGARGILINFTGSKNMTLNEMSDAVAMITKEAAETAIIKQGVVFSPSISEDEIEVTVIATGFESFDERKESAERAQQAQPQPQAQQQQPQFQQQPQAQPQQQPQQQYQQEQQYTEQAPEAPKLRVVNGAPIEINTNPFRYAESTRALSKDAKHDYPPYLKEEYKKRFDYPTFLRKQNS